MKLVIKLFPEIIVKSRPVRKQFISQLRKNLKKVLSKIVERVQIVGTWDVIELDFEADEQTEALVIDRLKSTPGIDFILKVNHFFCHIVHFVNPYNIVINYVLFLKTE